VRPRMDPAQTHREGRRASGLKGLGSQDLALRVTRSTRRRRLDMRTERIEVSVLRAGRVELCKRGRFVALWFGDRSIEYGSGFGRRAELALCLHASR